MSGYVRARRRRASLGCSRTPSSVRSSSWSSALTGAITTSAGSSAFTVSSPKFGGVSTGTRSWAPSTGASVSQERLAAHLRHQRELHRRQAPRRRQHVHPVDAGHDRLARLDGARERVLHLPQQRRAVDPQLPRQAVL